MSMEYVDLNNTEIKEKGQELANAVGELYEIRAEKKDSMNDFKKRIDSKEREIASLSENVRTGKEYRSRTFFDDKIEDKE